MKLKIFKMSTAFFVSMLMASLLQLNYAPSAGIVGLLTIQSTKQETIKICLKRLLSFVISLVCAFIVFHTVGYSAFGFAIFLIMFLSISFMFKLEDGIAMNAVITTHYLVEKSMSLQWICNEMMIFGIGIFFGFIINLYMPSQKQKIKESMYLLDEGIKELLNRMSKCFYSKQKSGILYSDFDQIIKQINQMIHYAFDDYNNKLYRDSQYQLQYLIMRQNQILVLKDIYDLMMKIEWTGEQARYISQYFLQMSKEFHEDNDVVDLKNELMQLYERFQKDELPKQRDEFENRAILYTIMHYVSKFLDLKQEFIRIYELEKI